MNCTEFYQEAKTVARTFVVHFSQIPEGFVRLVSDRSSCLDLWKDLSAGLPLSKNPRICQLTFVVARCGNLKDRVTGVLTDEKILCAAHKKSNKDEMSV